MWNLGRFEEAPVHELRRKRLNLDAADRVLEILCDEPRTEDNDGMGIKSLIGRAAWKRLAAGIRRRFDGEPGPGECRTYRGHFAKVACNWAGLLFAQFARLIGTPMAWKTGENVPCDVRIYRDKVSGIVWERRYDFGDEAPLIASTIKRKAANGDLLECFGSGAGMTLSVFECDRALHFVSRDFFLNFAGWRITLPFVLSPGRLHVTQHDKADGWFHFTMTVDHPLLGRIAEQDGTFRELVA